MGKITKTKTTYYTGSKSAHKKWWKMNNFFK